MIRIRGFGAVYDKISLAAAYADGMKGIIGPGAFKQMRDRPCTLQVGHEKGAAVLATVDGGNLKLFDTMDGLCFEAIVDPDASPEIAWLNNLRTFGVSIGDIQDAETSELELNGIPIRCMDRAICKHIALVAAPAYSDAICWNADVNIPVWNRRLLKASMLWDSGYADHLGKRGGNIVTSNCAGSSRKRAAAAAFKSSDALTGQMPKCGLASNPDKLRAERPQTKMTPKHGEPTTLDMMVEAVENIVDRLIALEEKVAGMESK